MTDPSLTKQQRTFRRSTSLATCPNCHRIVTIRKDGRYGQHRMPNSRGTCVISGSKP